MEVKELLLKLEALEEENEQLRNELHIVETDCKNVKESRNHYREENEQLRQENNEMRHELDSLSGCYCADNKEFKDYWRVGYERL